MRKYNNKNTYKYLWGILIGIGAILITAGLLFFLANAKKDNGFFDEGSSITDGSNNNKELSLEMFVTYDVFDGKIVKVYRDSYGEFVFVDENNSKIYSTDDTIESFRVLNANTFVYETTKHNQDNNMFIREIISVDIKTGESTLIVSGEKAFFEVSSGCIFISNGSSGEILYGSDLNNLKKAKASRNVSKLVSNKGKTFAICSYVIDGKYYSIIDELSSDGITNLGRFDGKVLNITVDYFNNNKIYYSTQIFNAKSKSSSVVVKSRLLKRLSGDEVKDVVLNEANYVLYSVKNGNVTFSEDKAQLILLNESYREKRNLSTLHKDMMYSLIKEDANGETLYFIKKDGSLGTF